MAAPYQLLYTQCVFDAGCLNNRNSQPLYVLTRVPEYVLFLYSLLVAWAANVGPCTRVCSKSTVFCNLPCLQYIEELWRKKQSDVLRFLLRVRCWEFRQMPSIVRLNRPSRPDKARRMGFKAKQGYVVYRVRVRRGGRKRPVHKARDTAACWPQLTACCGQLKQALLWAVQRSAMQLGCRAWCRQPWPNTSHVLCGTILYSACMRPWVMNRKRWQLTLAAQVIMHA